MDDLKKKIEIVLKIQIALYDSFGDSLGSKEQHIKVLTDSMNKPTKRITQVLIEDINEELLDYPKEWIQALRADLAKQYGLIVNEVVLSKQTR